MTTQMIHTRLARIPYGRFAQEFLGGHGGKGRRL